MGCDFCARWGSPQPTSERPKTWTDDLTDEQWRALYPDPKRWQPCPELDVPDTYRPYKPLAEYGRYRSLC